MTTPNSPNPSWKPGDKVNAPAGSMIAVDPGSIDAPSVYKIMISSIVPRPIAFVSTISAAGVGNLSPFSFFNGVSSNPPCIMFSVSRKADGGKKDTLRNIEETREFVINSASKWLAEPLVHTAADHPYGVDELQKVGLTALPSVKVKPVRVKESAVQMECELYDTLEVGKGGRGSATVVIGKVVMLHVLDSIYQDGKISLEGLEPLARLGGVGYCLVGDTYAMPTPKP